MQDGDDDGDPIRGEIRRGYGVDFEDQKGAEAARKVWFRTFWLYPLLTLGLWWEATPGGPLNPYQPVAYLSWILIVFAFVGIVGYRLIQYFGRTNDPRVFWQTTFAMQSRSRLSRWMRRYNCTGCAAFVFVALWTHRPFLALATVIMFATLSLDQRFENRLVRQKYDALAAGDDSDGEAP